jgi:hypothetical protein
MAYSDYIPLYGIGQKRVVAPQMIGLQKGKSFRKDLPKGLAERTCRKDLPKKADRIRQRRLSQILNRIFKCLIAYIVIIVIRG